MPAIEERWITAALRGAMTENPAPLENCVIPAVHGCCRFSGLPTMAYPLRAKAGIQRIKKTPAQAGQHQRPVRFAGCFFVYWIPAFAGMTG